MMVLVGGKSLDEGDEDVSIEEGVRLRWLGLAALLVSDLTCV